jgi:G3E family GTPase
VKTPLTVATGVDPDAMAATLVGLQWDLPGAVSVHHSIDPEARILTRVVSDATGVLERAEVRLDHACTSCALREDILPTLERLACDDRWSSILARLPAGAEARQLGHVLAGDTRLARHLRLASVVTVLSAGDVVDDLLGDDLLRDRGVHHGSHDGRGLGEVACAMVEYADIVVLSADPGSEGSDLVRALARPDVVTVVGSEQLDGRTAITPRHDHARTSAWISPTLDADLPDLGRSRAWRLDLQSPRPFHPGRLLDQIGRLGAGRHRSRGCFWLPSRPDMAQQWDGSGGQLSIGNHTLWTGQTPMTRLVLTGVGSLPCDLAEAFEELLVGPHEATGHPHGRRMTEDGLEPWLGPIRRVA